MTHWSQLTSPPGRPMNECPERTSVLFWWSSNGEFAVGRMERDVLRVGGHRKDLYWGGPALVDRDDDPPTCWFPLPEVLPAESSPGSAALREGEND